MYMDSFAYAIIASQEEAAARKKKLKLHRKILRDESDPFLLNDHIFQRNFRLNKAAFRYVLEDLKHDYDPGVFSSSIPLICRLAAVLRFLGEGGYQLGVGNDYEVGMAQSTFSSTLKNFLNVLERRLCPLWIKVEMTESEKREAKREFYSRASLPGVVMCVDGTHINIVAPSIEKGLYFNRKGHFSINTMLICDNNLKIRCVDARYPGSNHDAHVWNLITARTYFQRKYQEGDRNSFILGDAGYPLEPWLMTPYRSGEPGSPKSIYNIRHSKTRNVVERTIGVLKNRFRCTLGARQLHYNPRKVAQIINVVCALHNICIHYRVEDYTNINLTVMEEPEEANIDLEEINTYRNAAEIMRENIIRTYL